MSVDTGYSPPMTGLANTYPVKTTSSGKDIAIYCGYTFREWSPSIAQTQGVGGSEEAVIQLAFRWAAAGWSVTVYNASDREQQYFADLGAAGRPAAVTYRPYWLWNYRDREDVVILWRDPEIAKYPINARRVILDLHDVGPYNFSPEGLAKISYVCVKTQAHADCFPNIPREKLRIIPNGIDLEQFTNSVSKEKYLIINTSLANRSLSALLDIYEQVKRRVPKARLEWAYGWDAGGIRYDVKSELAAWKEKMQAQMKALGVVERGRLNSEEVTRLYQRGSVFLYPTGFYEIFCISAVKAQYAGAYPITSDFAALNEVVRWGETVPADLAKESWAKPNQFNFSITNRKREYVDKVVAALERQPQLPDSIKEDLGMRYSWNKVAEAWYSLFTT
jgi:glycosyltransferase involved in cell wall biosynthesis